MHNGVFNVVLRTGLAYPSWCSYSGVFWKLFSPCFTCEVLLMLITVELLTRTINKHVSMIGSNHKILPEEILLFIVVLGYLSFLIKKSLSWIFNNQPVGLITISTIRLSWKTLIHPVKCKLGHRVLLSISRWSFISKSIGSQ